MERRRRRAGWRRPRSRIGSAAAGVVVVVVVGAGVVWVARTGGHAGLDPAEGPSVAVDVELFRPDDDLSYEPVAVGDMLLSRVNRGAHSSPDFDLVTSTDGGRTWTTVALPQKPEDTD